jgi:hypothetical protein
MKKIETKSAVLLKHHLKALRLPAFHAECEKVAARCATENADHLGFLLQLCELELIQREKRAAERRLKAARFPHPKTLEDFKFEAHRTQEIHLDAHGAGHPEKALLSAMRRTVAMEGQPVAVPEDPIVGRWAGDRIALVGDYDSSRLWDRLHEYRNLTEELVEVWNGFIELGNLKLKFNPNCGCRETP